MSNLTAHRLAKLEKARGLGSPYGPFNSMLVRMGEPRRATESEAFVAFLQLANRRRAEHRNNAVPESSG